MLQERQVKKEGDNRDQLFSHIDFQSGYGRAWSKRMGEKLGDRCFGAENLHFG